MADQIKRLNIADEKFSKKKLLGFSMVRMGNILQGLMIGEVTYFATNSLGIAAAAISIGMAIKTAIDAVTDLLMGAIVDRTHTKWGKARPWVLAGIPMWILTLLVFAVPRSLNCGLYYNLIHAGQCYIWNYGKYCIRNTYQAKHCK